MVAPPHPTDPRVPVPLYTASGGYVHTVLVLPFILKPDVILWGNRYFVLRIQDGEAFGYYEGFVAIAMEPDPT